MRSYVVSLSESDWSELRVILMDKDEKAALRFLKEKVARPVELSLGKALDVGRGRV